MSKHRKKKAMIQTIAVGLIVPALNHLAQAVTVTNNTMAVTDVAAMLNGLFLLVVAVALFALKEFYDDLSLSDEEVGAIRVVMEKLATVVADRVKAMDVESASSDDIKSNTNKSE